MLLSLLLLLLLLLVSLYTGVLLLYLGRYHHTYKHTHLRPINPLVPSIDGSRHVLSLITAPTDSTTTPPYQHLYRSVRPLLLHLRQLPFPLDRLSLPRRHVPNRPATFYHLLSTARSRRCVQLRPKYRCPRPPPRIVLFDACSTVLFLLYYPSPR